MGTADPWQYHLRPQLRESARAQMAYLGKAARPAQAPQGVLDPADFERIVEAVIARLSRCIVPSTDPPLC